MHFPEHSRRYQNADLLDLCHSSSLLHFLDVVYHAVLYCTKCTNNHIEGDD